ncbi:MAG: hypothetical protein LC745_08485, partial [Planctomycetia bacterium]|nr:hypothetical protein [Planctomycetia bacterium]
MTREAPARRAGKRAAVVGLAFAAVVLMGRLPSLARLETWREESASAFAKGHRDRVIISDNGVIRLGHALKPLGRLDASRVWDLARGLEGDLYAATGDEGKVFRRDARDDSPWALVFDSPDSQALSLAVVPKGHTFVGTGPSGQVVDLTDPKHPGTRPHPGVQYVWDLAADPAGNLYAATGPSGQLWKRSVEGVWSLVFDSKHSHLLCVAVAPDGSVYAGSDGEGLVYKIAPGGKASVVYDAPQSEVRTLLVGLDGVVYAGTASEAGGGSGRGTLLFPGGSLTDATATRGSNSQNASTPPRPVQDTPPRPEPPKKEDARPRPPMNSGSGSASPRPVTAGDNAVYRIDHDGVVREVFRAKVLIFALALRDERLLIGTGPEGQIYEVRESGRESAPLARLDHGQILALVNEPGGGVFLGTGDPGSVLRLEPGHVPTGTIVSDVKDAKLISRFGAVSW